VVLMKIPVCSDMTLCVDHYIGSSVSVMTKLHGTISYKGRAGRAMAVVTPCRWAQSHVELPK
jgi:hypothetical protein